jgi:glycosyltransferase involved in cell wall biosynthesis
LKKAVDSVLCQSFTRFELIIIDDGSTDGTADLAGELTDARLRWLSHPERRGAAAARNTGIRHSRGMAIAFQDSDDTWLPEALAGLVGRMCHANERVGVVYAPFVRVKGRRETVFPPPSKLPEGDLQRELFYGNFITPQAALVRRECLAAAGGFDERLPCLVDWDLWLRLAQDYHFACFPEPAARLVQSVDGVSSDRGCLRSALALILDKHQAFFAREAPAFAWQNYLLGNLLCLEGDVRSGREYLLRAVRLQPGRTRYRLAVGLLRFGPRLFGLFYAVKDSILPSWY